MSSYYPSFNYKGINSKEKNLIVTHFSDGADTGEMDTFLNMEPVYTDNAYGTRRLDYGAKYSSVAVFRLTVVKQDGGEFSVSSIRDCLKWLTGSRTNSTLDLVDSAKETFTILADDSLPSFTMSNLYSRIDTVFINGEELTSWDYDTNSRKLSLHYGLKKGDTVDVIADIIKYSFIGRITNAWQYKMDARTVGLILEFTSVSPWAYSPPIVLTETISGSKTIKINNSSDDLYEYVYPKIVYKNNTSEGSLKITNKTTQETTQINGLDINEIVTMSNNMTITSDKPSKIFGNTFNFVFPRLAPGVNNLTIVGTGNITFEYVMYYKIGDCAIDINAKLDPICSEDGQIILDTLDWGRIVNTPNTLAGYGITDAYTKTEIDSALSAKANTATTLSGYGITDAYTKTEIDTALLNGATIIYLPHTITDIGSFLEYDSTDRIYIGTIRGFSTTFGYSSDVESKGFRMWFVYSTVIDDDDPVIPSLYRVVMFEDGTIWTAPRRSTEFTQISYSKAQVDNFLADKAGLDAYENVVALSTTISTADQLNDYINDNKTYSFYVIPPLSTDLASGAGTRCILNSYGGDIQIVRLMRNINKAFIREYSSISKTWSDFKDISIPDKSITKDKLDVELDTLLNNKLDNTTGSVKSLNIDSGAVTLSKLSDDVQALINSGGSGGGTSTVVIDEQDLNDMLAEVLV